MNCYQPMWLDSQKIFVPCGTCFACRQAKASEWSARLQLELASWYSAGFLTLTYNDENLPISDISPYCTLKPKDLQDFWKRLRAALSDVGRKIKYYACGEYGECLRAHYHAIVFGLSPNSVDRILVKKVWNKGRTSIDYVNRITINYVTKYVMKKFSKERNKELYHDKGILPPFQRCSRGLGLDFALSHGEELSRQLSVRLFTGKELPLPRYFVNKLGIDTERLKEKHRDSLVKYVSGIFKRAGLKSCSSVEHLGYMLFHSRDLDSSMKLSNVFDKINEQKSYNWKSRVSLYEKS